MKLRTVVFWCFCLMAALLAPALQAQTIVLKNDRVQRVLAFDGKVWRTTQFARADDSESLSVQSDEFQLRFFDDATLTVGDFIVQGQPQLQKQGPLQTLTIRYVRPVGGKPGPNTPLGCTVRYFARSGESYLRKQIEFDFPPNASVDRLEVERFSLKEKAERGGRGEPIFVDGKWFFGLEYPAGHACHTDGNTPAPDAHHYEKVGNYSFVGLEGRDRDTAARPGLIRLLHFPGFAKEQGGNWKITSKEAVAGIGAKGQPTELAFGDYLATIAKAPRSFTHYNNWFDPAGKNLSGDNFVNVWRSFKKVLDPYGIRLDAMVPDNGWQNRQSIWQPDARQFPGGMSDLKKLSDSLRREGTSLGLWLSLDGTTNDIKWGESQGYALAKANPYFSQYFAHFSLSQPKYQAALDEQLRRLVKESGVTYFKHDFNHLSDTGEGNGHPATDRHGHEANVDAMISLLAACRAENPQIYQNLTNWVWFSPWWLMHGDALWMLAGDDGFNGNWPELSSRAMATTDRDVYLWRMWGNPKDRPLVPISHLMTHGIVRNAAGQMESKQDTLADWADHVMMYYGRGVQMKEWYISPAAMNDDYWRVLATIHKWSEKNFKALSKTVFVGGRPDEGQAYGYVGWDRNHGVLVARNPSARPQLLSVPCDASTRFRGEADQFYRARVLYPYHDNWPIGYRSGQTMNFELPGYATMAFEIELGAPQTTVKAPRLPLVNSQESKGIITAEVAVPDEAMPRCDLLVIGYDQLPAIKINDAVATPPRSSTGRINAFAGYAVSGMPSDKARPWKMAAYDLKGFRGQKVMVQLSAQPGMDTSVESWLLLERPVAGGAIAKDAPWPPSQNARRQTVRICAETELTSFTLQQRALSAEEVKTAKSATLMLEVFGINGGQYGIKEAWLNSVKVGNLPECGDDWKRVSLKLPDTARATLAASNRLEVRGPNSGDMFKFRRATLRVELANGELAGSSVQGAPQTSLPGWSFFEGRAFPTPIASAPILLEFKAP